MALEAAVSRAEVAVAEVAVAGKPQHSARGLVVKGDQLLLMERWRPGLHYFSIPGGGIEPGETPEQTALREIDEETTLQVTIDREVLIMRDGDLRHHIYLCNYVSGEPALLAGAPEAAYGPDNRFLPRWVLISDLPRLPFIYWEPLQQSIIDGLRDGFDDTVKIVTAPPSR